MNARFAATVVVGITMLAMAPAHAATTVWAATQVGVYKSIDSGATWQNVPVNVDNSLLRGTDPQTPDVSAIAVDPQQPATVYFTGVNQGSTGNGFYRSTDNGKTWTSTVLLGIPVRSPVAFQTAWILIDPVMTNVIYLGYGGGIARSTDYGATFSKLTGPIPPNQTTAAVPDGLSLDPTTSGLIYLSALARIFRSTDYGDTWTILSNPATGTNALHLGNAAVDPRNANVILLGTTQFGTAFCDSTPSESCGLWRSSDRGQSWKSVAPVGQYYQIAYDIHTSDPSASSDTYVNGSVSGLGQAILKTTDNGNTWNAVNNKAGGFLPIADPGTSGTLYGYFFNNNTIAKSTDGAATFTTTIVVRTGNSTNNVHQLAVPSRVGNVSAASFRSGPVTAESIVTAVGFNLATGSLANSSDQVPTNLLGTTVTVIDSTGTSRLAPLFFVSAGQVNYEVPEGTAPGIAHIVIQNGSGFTVSAPLGITSVSPGIFELNGSHLAAAYALRVRGSSQTYENVYQVDSSNAVIPNPVDLGPDGDQVYLLLFGTGLRAATQFTVTIGGVSVPVLSGGAQGQFIGEDQVNIGPLPRSLAGRGSVDLILNADGKTANLTSLTFK